VLDTMPHVKVSRHAIPNAQAKITTPLVWRRGEMSASVLSLRTLVASLSKQKAGREAISQAAPVTRPNANGRTKAPAQ